MTTAATENLWTALYREWLAAATLTESGAAPFGGERPAESLPGYPTPQRAWPELAAVAPGR